MVINQRSNKITVAIIFIATAVIFYPIVMMLTISLKSEAEFLKSPFGPLLSV